MDKKGKVKGCMCEGEEKRAWVFGSIELKQELRKTDERRHFVGRTRNTLSCLSPYSFCPFLSISFVFFFTFICY